MKRGVKRAGPRGWHGRGGGASTYVQAPPEWRATTVQTCGLYPFAAGASTPMVGVPLGRRLDSRGGTVCCDPISWFQRANLLSNPSEFVLGLPGLGKSTVVRRQVAGLHGYGVVPLILGDLKPDYVDLIRELGGQVITLGRGRGRLNVLDPGEAREAAVRLVGSARTGLLEDAHGRRATMVSALLTILRAGVPPTDREESILDRSLRVLDDRSDGVPVLGDLLQVVRDAPDDVRAVAIDRGSLDRYRELTEGLEASLVALLGSGRLGELFSGQTTTRQRRDRPVVFDVSSIGESEGDLAAAALLACWSAGFASVKVAHALADAGLEPRRHYFAVLDELWRPLRAGRGMVDRIDGLTRLNRNEGVGQALITHTMSDLRLADPADTAKAQGFVARSGMVLAMGLPRSEMDMLRTVAAFSEAEADLLTSWTTPPAWDARAGAEAPPPGRGKVLVKVGGRPGIPVQTRLTAVELALGDTNRLWHEVSRVGALTEASA